jgi:hypothetical protein
MYCGVTYGEKEPLDNTSETHGACKYCQKLALEGFFDDNPRKLLDKKGITL